MGMERFTKAYQDKSKRKKLLIIVLVGVIVGAFMLSTRRVPTETVIEKTNREIKERTQKNVFETTKFNASQAQSIYTGELGTQKDVWLATGQKQLNEQNCIIN